MPTYKAPLRDMHFLINEVLDYPAHYATLSNGGEATPDMVTAILEGAATFSEEVLAPLNLKTAFDRVQSSHKSGRLWA
jgi:hypothetical protein